MEKKLKINFILKGIAIFAFVAFCLLAILAGVTLPFVSNASTSDSTVIVAESDYNDSAFASAESDTFNPLDFCISLSECNTTDTYYGFYISDSLWNYVRNYDYSQSSGLLSLFYLTFIDSTSPLYFVAGKTDNIAYLALTDMNNMIKYFEDNFNYSYFTPYIVYPQGFKLSNVLEGVSSGSLLGSIFKVFTSVPYGSYPIQVTNYGFESRFGFISSMPSNNQYFNLQGVPIIPSNLLRVYDSTDTSKLVNGYYTSGYDFYLPLVNAFDTFGNVIDGGFTGWRFVNVKQNGNYSYKFSLDFLLRNVVVCHIADNLTLSNGVFSAPDYANIVYNVQNNIENSDNLVVYGLSNLQYSYYLNNNFSQNDVYKFFAIIDYRNYKPLDNQFYVAGYNAAGDFNYNNGYNAGYSSGEKSGYNNGFSAGDAKGYQRGLSQGSNYSFLSLFGAIFDAPIQALFGGTQRLPAGTKITDSNGNTITLTSDTIVNRGGMLNFDLMGVNLSGFVLALFSMSIIIIVIKFALAKK